VGERPVRVPASGAVNSAIMAIAGSACNPGEAQHYPLEARMVADPRPPLIGVEEYLTAELVSPVKHEYIHGRVYAMSGGTANHATIAVNVVSLLRGHVRGGPCRVYNSDMKVQVDDSGLFFYPDASLSCDERDRGTVAAVRFPTLIVEVLSPSTEAFDRGDKFAYYRANATLQEYVLIGSERVTVECYRRGPGELWTLRPFAAGDDVTIESVGFRCPVAALYEDVQL
jgi:Uma2 family endonuclease